MSQFQDRILSSFYAIWLIDYASAPGPYTFHINIYDLSIIQDRILSQTVYFTSDPYSFLNISILKKYTVFKLAHNQLVKLWPCNGSDVSK